DLGDATGRGIDQLEGRDLAVSQPRHGLDRGHPPEFIAHRISYSGASTHLSCRSRRLILSIRTVAIAGSPSSAHSDPITRTRDAPEGTARERQATSPLPLMGHDDTANVMLDKRRGEDLLLGVLYAGLGAFTFALNNVMMRRGVVTGSVLQGMALTVPVGGLS